MAAKGGFSIDTTIAASSTYTETIDLQGSYQAAIIQFQVPESATTNYRKYGSCIVAGTTTDEAIAGSNFKQSITLGCGCFTSTIGFKFYLYQNDSRLSDDAFRGGTIGPVRLKEAYIDGTDLKLIFDNTHATQQALLKVDGRFFVWKAQSI